MQNLYAQQPAQLPQFVVPNITKKAQFPGGNEALKQFLAKNLVYPLSAKLAGIEGQVVVRFIVSENGKVTDFAIIKSLDAACDNEVLRIVSLMPKWEPAEQTVEIDGKSVQKGISLFYTMPVNFRLEENQGVKE